MNCQAIISPLLRPVRDALQFGVDVLSGRRIPDMTTLCWLAVFSLAALGLSMWLRGRRT